MANENYNIYDVDNYITSLQDGGTILFLSLLASNDPAAPGQVWTVDDSWNNVTVSCQFSSDSTPMYLTANSATDGDYIGSAVDRTANSFWSMAGDGSLQLINDGNATGLYAIIGDNGILTLASSPRTKWKFSKTVQGAKGWEIPS